MCCSDRLNSPPNSDIGPSDSVAVHALMGWAEFTDLGALLTDERVERRLVAVLAADVAGYSRLTGTDEESTLALSYQAKPEMSPVGTFETCRPALTMSVSGGIPEVTGGGSNRRD
jgi:hypothetical protein